MFFHMTAKEDSQGTESRELSPQQLGAIRRKIRLGKEIQVEYPQVASMYRKGMFAEEIVEELGLNIKYDATIKNISDTVRCAIRGHDGTFGIDSYVGLIEDQIELERLHREHKARAGHINGLILGPKMYATGRGAFSLAAERRREVSQRAGLVGGQSTYKKGKGIFSLSAAELRENSRKGTLARGQKPWTDKEKQDTLHLATLPKYQHKKGKNRDLPNWKLIVKQNSVDHHDGKYERPFRSIQETIRQYKKTLTR
jgi:hypothetical protein